jgi:hypothetical protein
VTSQTGQTSWRLQRDEALPLLIVLCVWVIMLFLHPKQALVDDVARFAELANANGRPYVDFPVEYPPLTTALVRVLGAGSTFVVMLQVGVLNAIGTLFTWIVLRRAWSKDAGRQFLWFMIPLQLFMPFRVDALSIALATVGIALATARKEIAGGLAVAAAVLLRVWPAALLPGLLVMKRKASFLTSVTATVLAVIAWAVFYGLDAVHQVTSFRGATGWHIESVYGVVAYLLGNGDPRFEAGALRLGSAPGWALVASRFATIAIIAWIWYRSRDGSGDPMGRPAVASIAVLILLSPLSSPQYVAWLTPWAAIAAAERRSRDIRMLMMYLTVFASATFLGYWGHDDPRLIVFMGAARAACLLGLFWVGVFRDPASVVTPSSDQAQASASR